MLLNLNTIGVKVKGKDRGRKFYGGGGERGIV